MGYSEIKYYQCDNCIYSTDDIDRICSHVCSKKEGCRKPFEAIFKENPKYPDDYLICGFSKIGDSIQLCKDCKK